MFRFVPREMMSAFAAAPELVAVVNQEFAGVEGAGAMRSAIGTAD